MSHDASAQADLYTGRVRVSFRNGSVYLLPPAAAVELAAELVEAAKEASAAVGGG